MDLLKQTLTSKSPLSDVFLANGVSKEMYSFSPKIGQSNFYCGNYNRNLKVIVRKSRKKIFYAEAEEDFVDFIFSFLTAPIGSILKLLDGNSSLGCMDNLYKSVKDLNSSWFIRPLGIPLLDPQVAPQFGLRHRPLQLYEQGTPTYWFGIGYVNGNGVISKNHTLGQNSCAMRLFDPRSLDGTEVVGFVKRPSTFIVWDDLQVIPLANTSSISLMQNLNVPLDDLEEHVVTIGEAEVTIHA